MRAAWVVLLACCACGGDDGGLEPDAAAIDAAPLPSVLPALLSETGLYADIASKTLADGLVAFTPANVLWSDDAAKQRWIHLPAGTQIDSSDMNHWMFPVGTQLFKEFALNGKRLETRVIWRVADTGDRERDTLVGAYEWNDAETDATFVPAGAMNVRGTDHDVPDSDACWHCHLGEPGHVLGYSALQLGSLDGIALSNPPPPGTTYGAPDAAQGYLHANCGHCHNPDGPAWVDSHMVLRLDVDEHDAATTKIVQTTVGAPLEQWIGRGFTYRIVAGDPDQSAVFYRMMQRTQNVQMPPLATEHVDPAGIALLRTWIEAQ